MWMFRWKSVRSSFILHGAFAGSLYLALSHYVEILLQSTCHCLHRMKLLLAADILPLCTV